jgi:hypothetical protein
MAAGMISTTTRLLCLKGWVTLQPPPPPPPPQRGGAPSTSQPSGAGQARRTTAATGFAPCGRRRRRRGSGPPPSSPGSGPPPSSGSVRVRVRPPCACVTRRATQQRAVVKKKHQTFKDGANVSQKKAAKSALTCGCFLLRCRHLALAPARPAAFGAAAWVGVGEGHRRGQNLPWNFRRWLALAARPFFRSRGRRLGRAQGRRLGRHLAFKATVIAAAAAAARRGLAAGASLTTTVIAATAAAACFPLQLGHLRPRLLPPPPPDGGSQLSATTLP